MPDLMDRYPRAADLEPAARRRIPRFAWDYLDHGAGAETLLTRNRAAFDAVTLEPAFLHPRPPVELSCDLFGIRYDAPFGVSPVGFGGMVWPGADRAIARAAHGANIPYALSTVANASIEETGAITEGRFWFQLYPPRDESIRSDLLDRAWQAGCRVLVLTIDTPGPSRRERAAKSGMSYSMRPTARNFAQAAMRPRWSLAVLRHGLPEFVNFAKYAPGGSGRSGLVRLAASQIGWPFGLEVTKQIRDAWKGTLVLKGVLCPADAKAAREIGADAVIVSNHGGRQSDGARPSLEALPDIRQTLGGNIPVMLDSGVRSGLDIERARARGAAFVMLGRPFYTSVAALGPPGPAHLIDILRAELVQTRTYFGPSATRGPV